MANQLQTLSKPLIECFQDAMYILRERKWIVITVLFMAGTLGYLTGHFQHPVYQSTCRLQVDFSDPHVLKDIESVMSLDAQNKEYINTQVKLLKSHTLARAVVESLFLESNKPFQEHFPDHLTAEEILQLCYTVQPVRNSRLIDITVEHHDPDLATALANRLAEDFIKLNLDQRMSTATAAVEWLREQSLVHREKLEESEAALQAYRAKTHSVSLEEKQNIVVAKLKDLNANLTEAETERIGAEHEWMKVQEALDSPDELINIPAIAVDKMVTTIRSQIIEHQVQLSSLQERYKAKHPDMIKAQKELEELLKKHEQACEEAAKTIQIKYLIARSKEEGLQKALTAHEQVSLDLDKMLAEYNHLKRDAEIDQQLYNNILLRMKETGITQQLETHNIRVADPAESPKKPIRPNKLLNIIVALILGLGAGVLLAFVVHNLDDRFRRVDDIERALNMPVLGIIPTIRKVKEEDRRKLILVDKASINSEAFRILRANILGAGNLKGQTLMITSAEMNAGKSLVSSNLAYAMAQNKTRTLLIDADLKRPVIQKMFKLPKPMGVTEYLRGEYSIEEIIQDTETEHLKVIHAGQATSQSSELLGSPRLDELIKHVKQAFDLIIFDTTPASGVSDALVLMQHVDNLLFVINFNSSKRRVVSTILQKAREDITGTIGCVINQADLRRPGYNYYYYGGYGSNDYYSAAEKSSS